MKNPTVHFAWAVFFSLRENQRQENIHKNTFLNKVNFYNNISVVEMKNG